MTHSETLPRRDDLATIAALAAIAYVLSMLAHEALGHGGACLVAGGRVTALWALDLRCDLGGFTAAERAVRSRVVAGAGPLVPLLIGLPILVRVGWMRTNRRSAASEPSPSRTLFGWLLSALLVLPNVGYLCLAPARAGDWGIALAGVEGALRLGIAAAGVVLYAAATRALVRQLGAALPVSTRDGVARARRIAWTGYAVANLLAAGAAARQLGAASGLALSGWSGALASLAGTSGLLWGVLGMRADHPARAPLRPVMLRWGVIAAGVAAAVLFIAVLGRGVRLGR